MVKQLRYWWYTRAWRVRQPVGLPWYVIFPVSLVGGFLGVYVAERIGLVDEIGSYVEKLAP